MTPIDDFSLLVCLAAISARAKDKTKQADADAHLHLLCPVNVKFELEFDSSAALATLHGARQVLRAAFAAKRIDAAHVRSVIDTSRSNPVIALYVCGMLALMVAQHAVATRVDRLDALLSAMLGVLAHHAANEDVATPHALHTCRQALATMHATVAMHNGDEADELRGAILLAWALNISIALGSLRQQQD